MRQKWKTLTLLSIIVPVGLLVSLRLTGILPEPEGPIIAETITLETVKWEIERPPGYINIWDNLESLYEEEIKLWQEISIDDYYTESWGYGGSDYIALMINLTASLEAGFVNSVNITFSEDYGNSEIRFFEVQAWPKFYSHAENFSISDYAHHLWGSGLKAFMELTGVDHPKRVRFDGIVHWILRSPKDKTHLMEIATELVYYNGTAFKKIVQPFQLKIALGNNTVLKRLKKFMKDTIQNYSLVPLMSAIFKITIKFMQPKDRKLKSASINYLGHGYYTMKQTRPGQLIRHLILRYTFMILNKTLSLRIQVKITSKL